MNKNSWLENVYLFKGICVGKHSLYLSYNGFNKKLEIA